MNEIVKYSEGIKARDLTGVQDHRWLEYQDHLTKSMMMLGMGTPQNPESMVMSDYDFTPIREMIQENFKDFSAAEISKAFQLYAADKIEIPKDRFINKSNLNCAFIGYVLKEYRQIRKEELYEYNRINQKALPQSSSYEISEIERKKVREEYFQNCFVKPYDNILSHGTLFMDDMNATNFFDRFKKAGAINVTDQERAKYFKQAENVLLEEWSAKKLQGVSKEFECSEMIRALNEMRKGIGAGNSRQKQVEKATQDTAKALYFKDWMRQQSRDKKTAEELLNLIR